MTSDPQHKCSTSRSFLIAVIASFSLARAALSDSHAEDISHHKALPGEVRKVCCEQEEQVHHSGMAILPQWQRTQKR